MRGCANAGAAPSAATTAVHTMIRFTMISFSFSIHLSLVMSSARLGGVRIAAERVRDGGDRALRADAVPGVVQRGRDDGDAEFAGRDGDDAAADAALRGQPGVIEPLARVVVEAGGRHDGEDVRHFRYVNDLLARDRVLAHVGERPR